MTDLFQLTDTHGIYLVREKQHAKHPVNAHVPCISEHIDTCELCLDQHSDKLACNGIYIKQVTLFAHTCTCTCSNKKFDNKHA